MWFSKRWKALQWTTPGIPPHGVCGVVAVGLGYYFLAQALLWGPDGYTIDGPYPLYIFYIYLVSMAACAIAGIQLRRKSPQPYTFLHAGLVQLSLIWWTFRFAQHQQKTLQLVVWMDRCVATYLACVSLAWILFGHLLVQSALYQALTLAVAVLQSALLYGYQLAWYGPEWLTCVYEQYPWQRVGFTAYVFNVLLLVFAQILFGATLNLRKIWTPLQFCGFIVPTVVGSLVATMLLMEYYLTEVSTQRLWIACLPEQAWSRHIDDALNGSRYIQDFFDKMKIALLDPARL